MKKRQMFLYDCSLDCGLICPSNDVNFSLYSLDHLSQYYHYFRSNGISVLSSTCSCEIFHVVVL